MNTMYSHSGPNRKFKISNLLPDHLHHMLAPPQLGKGAFRIVETVEKNF